MLRSGRNQSKAIILQLKINKIMYAKYMESIFVQISKNEEFPGQPILRTPHVHC